MALTLTVPNQMSDPYVPGNRRTWKGLLTIDNTYVNGTGLTIAPGLFGYSTLDHVTIAFNQAGSRYAAWQGSAAGTVKIFTTTTGVEIASTAGSGDVFAIEASGI